MNNFIPYKKPASNEKVVATIRVDLKILEKIDTIASNIGASRNELINQCIEYALENLEEDNENSSRK